MNKKIATIIGVVILALNANAIVIPAPAPGGAVNQYLVAKNENTPKEKDNDTNPNNVLYFIGTVALIIGLFGIGEIICHD